MATTPDTGPDPALAHWYQARRSDGCRTVRQILSALETLEDLTGRFLIDHAEGCPCDYCAFVEDALAPTGPRLGAAARACIGSLHYATGQYIDSFRCDCRVSN